MMKDEDSIFGVHTNRLNRLVFQAMDDSAADPHTPQATSLNALVAQLGTQIDRYKLLRVLGEGGMGMVYLAEQEGQIRRKVALKVIKPGMDSQRVIARFESERQALALLEHPNIAQVYDAGTTEAGRPYFVMEHVKGLTITAYCDHHKLDITARLRLFQQVCLAVHHAHQKGIIHRDIKPSNILVSAENDRPTPKIIDFGVAKALSQPLTQRTLFTEDSQLIGTPEYMSPEQAEMINEDIDTRSDIYSLGVLLYELLAGILPFDSDTLREGGIDNIRRVIRETDPKTPSTRLTKLGDEARKLAEKRRTEVAALAKCLHYELEWIPLKAMRKERSERYRSASELVDDIENYLQGAPLIAGPLGNIYKLKKFVRRNKVLVSSVTTVIVVLFAGVTASTIYATRLARALDDNELITKFLKDDVLGSADEATYEEARVSYMLDAASKNLETKFQNKPLIQVRLRRTLSGTYRNLGEYDKAEQHALKVIDICKQHYGEAHPATLNAMDYIGWVYIKQGRFRNMERLYNNIHEIRERVRGKKEPSMNLGLACAYIGLGKYEEAELLLDRWLKSAQTTATPPSSKMLYWYKWNLADVYIKQGRYKDVERLFVELQQAEYEERDATMVGFALVYQAQGHYAKAEPLFEQALQESRKRKGNEFLHTMEKMHDLARLYVDQNRYAEAQTLFDEALSIARRRRRPDHPGTLALLNDRAVLYTKLEQYDQAGKCFDEALKGRRRELGDDHPNTLETLNDVGILRREQGQYVDAENLLVKAHEGQRNKLGPDHPATLESMHELGLLYLAQSQYEKAESQFLKAYHGRETKLGLNHPHTIESLKQLIKLYESWDKPQESEKWQVVLQEIESMIK
ncbi:tetratricopeptide repeat protein [Planctomycetota bacterium]